MYYFYVLLAVAREGATGAMGVGGGGRGDSFVVSARRDCTEDGGCGRGLTFFGGETTYTWGSTKKLKGHRPTTRLRQRQQSKQQGQLLRKRVLLYGTTWGDKVKQGTHTLRSI